jgi:hypothetical protein
VELQHSKTTLEAGWAITTNQKGVGGGQRLAFIRAIQNVVTAAVLLDTLPVPSTSGVDKVYQQLKDFLGTVAMK